MRPPRQDIAAPPLPDDVEWVGGRPPRLERLVAEGPLLVHFFDFAQLNSARALPYVEAWTERYAGEGLSTVGVHTARFPFTDDPAAVSAALPGLGIGWPVAVDAGQRIWRAYGCEGWPSLFLWSRGGALRWYQLGEGDYEETEAAIRDALEEAGREGAWPEPLSPLRPSDAPGATVVAPTPELFPGGSPGAPFTASVEAQSIELTYEAGGVHLAAAGEGEVAVSLDGKEREAVQIRGPGLHEVLAHERTEAHELELRPGPGVELYSVQFEAAPPA